MNCCSCVVDEMVELMYLRVLGGVVFGQSGTVKVERQDMTKTMVQAAMKCRHHG
jgi:hypothetical protein